MTIKKVYKIILLLFLIIIITTITHLYFNNVLGYLNLKIVLLLLKNRINFFKFIISDDISLIQKNFISSGDFELLLIELILKEDI